VGLPVGIPVYAGINDGASTTLGSGVVRLGQSIITLATNGVCRAIVDQKLAPQTIIERHLFSWPYIDHLWIGGGFTYSGANSLQWLADQFGLSREPEVYDSLLDVAASVPAGSNGVTFLPYLAGRGTPNADPDLRGGFLNLSLAHERGELTRAVLEGTTYALAEIYEEFAALNIHVDSIFVSGGGARSALWRQIIADVLDCPVTYTGGGATLGSAIIAAVGLGFYPDIPTAAQAMVDVHAQHEPISDSAAQYRQLFAAFKQLRDAWQAIHIEETSVE
jgi:xylulokinase